MHGTSRAIRVLLAGMPPMLRDIVRETLARQPDMTVVDERNAGERLGHALATTNSDVVIIGTSGPEDVVDPFQLLVVRPQARVVMLAVNGRNATIYELRPHRTALGDVSPQALVDAIREHASDAVWPPSS